MKKLFGLAGLVLILIFPVLSWARGGGGCLEEGTPVLTPKGLIAIEKLRTDDRVWSITGGKLKEARVRAIMAVQPEKYLEISAGEALSEDYPRTSGDDGPWRICFGRTPYSG